MLFVVENDAPDRFYKSDNEGNYKEVARKDLSDKMLQDYGLVSSGLEREDLSFDKGVLSFSNSVSGSQNNNDKKELYQSFLGLGLEVTGNKMYNRKSWHRL